MVGLKVRLTHAMLAHTQSAVGFCWTGVTVAALWVVAGELVLLLNDVFVKKESVLGQQEIAWSQIVETQPTAWFF